MTLLNWFNQPGFNTRKMNSTRPVLLAEIVLAPNLFINHALFDLYHCGYDSGNSGCTAKIDLSEISNCISVF